MNPHLFLLMLLLIPQWSWAQASDEKQKPSWSQGLPERTKAPTTQPDMIDIKDPSAAANDDLRPEMDLETDMSDFDLGMDLPKAKPPVTEPIEAVEPVDTTEPQQVVVAEPEVKVALPEPALSDPDEYNWRVIESHPIVIPRTYFYDKDSVKVKVTINPEGEVVRVKGSSRNLSQSVVFSVQKQLKNWRFDPPANHGITSSISKVHVLPVE